MQQRFKSVYFADHPSGSTKRRHLKLAFGSGDADLFQAVGRLSSEDVRHLLGYGSFNALKAGAAAERTSLNAFCLHRLRQAAAAHGEAAQLDLFPAEIDPARSPRFDPIQATYRGGVNEPLHDWYPYLEGYSPEFVKNVLHAFAPTATRVLDPFAGTGTTPLTVARANCRSFYCELNPLLQFLVGAKAMVLAMPGQDRMRLAARLSGLADDLRALLAEHEPDQRLIAAYHATFGDSVFFPRDTLESCLKLRSLIDAAAYQAPVLASMTTVAAVASLVPCSHLMRRGDLRFRKGVECDARADLVEEVASRLRIMARDVVRLPTVPNPPLFVAGDAKRLIRVADLEVDAIVTSPPYLNGTNYYRNTKIELWFLRVLSSGSDLSSLRRRTVTAGINDVTLERQSSPVSKSVEEVVRALDDRAYDRRIPRMVLNYFADMDRVFAALLRHAAPAAALVIDIGDSAYAGVRVDTPQILAELLGARGWRVNHEMTLRQRLSRSGQPLRQIVLAATAPSRKPRPSRTSPWWGSGWVRFKQELPHQRGPFSKRNWGNPLHSLCSYQGKMKPSLAHHLVRTFARPGDRLLDPFGGVGTIPFEAALHGVAAWSFDLSPATIPVARAKLLPASKEACQMLVDELDRFIGSHRPTPAEANDAASIQFNGPLPGYFHPKTFAEILLARRFFQERPPESAASALVFSCLLHVLHGNRPYALSRRSHPITPFAPTGVAEYKRLIDKLARKVERCFIAERSADFVNGTATYQDATGIWPQEVDELDAVITSPPFFDSTRFYLANWMRLWFSGWTSKDFKERPHAFLDERQKRDFDAYQPVIRQARERLKPGGVCVLHLGRSRKCDMAAELTAVAAPWFRNIDVFAESVAHCESHGIRDKGTVVEHTYLILS